ncbi:late competence development ComFB family protein [Sporosarcina sp. Sa2YVA2]|uniref:Late competence development ComFB family protein n=1 Tax=Sporosarcina quadrami TaxID=2762234 RepID=A0ABR8UAZ9_9BACL|nr:late competence development ComFB family protein [Sporosarcina quadrami]MBD7985196.1 late competence development ComFB family protein [Sporosarcina quadrami]
MPVYNVMEEVIYDVLHQYKKELKLSCECERCKDDIMAIALNQVKPQYIVNEKHTPYIRAAHVADRQGATNILSTVIKAARIVADSPRCDNHNKTT